MRPVHLIRRVLLVVLAAVLLAVVGLVVAAVSTLPARGAGASASPTPAPTPSAVPTPLQVVSDSLADLAPEAVVVQLAYEGGLTSTEEGQPFGRVPPFTLYADGQMIWVPFSAPRRVLESMLSAADIAAVLQQVYDRGFGHLESYTSQCRIDSAGNGECVADAGMSILRARLPDGTLREVRNYADYANDPTALRAIRERLSSFSYPAAHAYRPTRATLFLSPVHGDFTGVTIVPWPLAAEVLTPPRPVVASWARVLTGAEYATLLAASGTPLGDVYIEHEGGRYRAFVVPWLPDVDYTAQVAAYNVPLPTPSASASARP